jgi:hypothetical protein
LARAATKSIEARGREANNEFGAKTSGAGSNQTCASIEEAHPVSMAPLFLKLGDEHVEKYGRQSLNAANLACI